MDNKPIPRILIADEHRLLAEACAKMLRPEFEVVGIVTDGSALVQKTLTLKPNAVILDLDMPKLNGLDAVGPIRKELPFTRFVFLTMNTDPNIAAEMFRRGASGYILKRSGADEFVNAIRTVMAGRSYRSSLVSREAVTYIRQHQQRQESQITRREREILQLLAEGRIMKDVADVLNITPATVAFHKYNMMEKLGVSSNAGLLLYALKHHMVPVQESA